MMSVLSKMSNEQDIDDQLEDDNIIVPDSADDDFHTSKRLLAQEKVQALDSACKNLEKHHLIHIN